MNVKVSSYGRKCYYEEEPKVASPLLIITAKYVSIHDVFIKILLLTESYKLL